MTPPAPMPTAPSPANRRQVLTLDVLRCLGAGCVDRDLCARHRDLGTPGSRCVSSLMDDRGYPCHALIRTWFMPNEQEQGATP